MKEKERMGVTEEPRGAGIGGGHHKGVLRLAIVSAIQLTASSGRIVSRAFPCSVLYSFSSGHLNAGFSKLKGDTKKRAFGKYDHRAITNQEVERAMKTVLICSSQWKPRRAASVVARG